MAKPPTPLFTLPLPFPTKTAEAVKNQIAAKMTNPSPELDSLLGAYNGILFRLRAAADYSEEFSRSLRRYGDAPALARRYQQERQLFGFFVSGLAALESFHYFLFFAGAELEPDSFRTLEEKALRAINRKSTTEAYGKAFPAEPITTALKQLNGNHFNEPAAALHEWEIFRNTLMHRSAPGRLIYMSWRDAVRLPVFGDASPADPAAQWKIRAVQVKIDANLTPLRLRWLLDTFVGLINAVDQFAQKYF